jgi:hypothetical protein
MFFLKENICLLFEPFLPPKKTHVFHMRMFIWCQLVIEIFWSKNCSFSSWLFNDDDKKKEIREDELYLNFYW